MDLIVFFISDAEDQSEGNVSRYADTIKRMVTTNEKYFFALTVLDEDGQLSPQCTGEGSATFRVQEFIRRFRGGVANICAEDYAVEIPSLIQKSIQPWFPYIELPPLAYGKGIREKMEPSSIRVFDPEGNEIASIVNGPDQNLIPVKYNNGMERLEFKKLDFLKLMQTYPYVSIEFKVISD